MESASLEMEPASLGMDSATLEMEPASLGMDSTTLEMEPPSLRMESVGLTLSCSRCKPKVLATTSRISEQPFKTNPTQAKHEVMVE